jgi:hypothetical protein
MQGVLLVVDSKKYLWPIDIITMNLDRDNIIDRAFKLARISREFSFKISRPATRKDIMWRQKHVEHSIPPELVRFASDTASRVSLEWEIQSVKERECQSGETFPKRGSFEFNFYSTDLSVLDDRWTDAFAKWQEFGAEPNPFEVKDVFPVFKLMSGDLIVAIIGEHERGAIYYLDHEGGANDWTRLAVSYGSFLTTLAELWFPSMEWWDSLEKFYDKNKCAISTGTDFSKRWISFIHTTIELSMKPGFNRPLKKGSVSEEGVSQSGRRGQSVTTDRMEK